MMGKYTWEGVIIIIFSCVGYLVRVNMPIVCVCVCVHYGYTGLTPFTYLYESESLSALLSRATTL